MWLWVVHDLNPRALSPRVRGFAQAQSWFQGLAPVQLGWEAVNPPVTRGSIFTGFTERPPAVG